MPAGRIRAGTRQVPSFPPAGTPQCFGWRGSHGKAKCAAKAATARRVEKSHRVEKARRSSDVEVAPIVNVSRLVERPCFMFATVMVTVCVFGVPAAAAHSAGGTAPCARTTIAERKMPTGPAQYQSGILALRNGASMRLQGGAGEMYQAKQFKVGDPVAACYGPLREYADAGPSVSMTVLDLRNGLYYGTLIGNWPAR